MDVIDAPFALYPDRQLRSKESCQALGLDCNQCVKSTALSVAAICPDIFQAAAHRLFSELYPDACCAPMGLSFIRAYRDANRRDQNDALHAA